MRSAPASAPASSGSSLAAPSLRGRCSDPRGLCRFEEKITDIAPTPDWDDDRRVIICDKVREAALNGAALIGAFAVQPTGHQVLVGAAVLDGRPMGRGLDSLDLIFLTVGTSVREVYLKGDKPGTQLDLASMGIEQVLFDKISAEAKARGARKLFISRAANLGEHLDLPGMVQGRARPSASALNGL